MHANLTILRYLFCLSFLPCRANTYPVIAPLTLSGRISNCPETILYCYYKNESDETLSDTLHLAKDGSFFLETGKINRPSILNIRNNNIQLNGLLVAPGYDLHITADGSDYLTLFKTKKILGKGSAPNLYRLKYDSLDVSNILNSKKMTLFFRYVPTY